METVLDIRNLLKRYGIFIYTGDRIGDLEMMEMELKDLYDAKLVDIHHYQKGLLILRREKAELEEGV